MSRIPLLICSLLLASCATPTGRPAPLLHGLSGDIEPGGMVIGATDPDTDVSLDGRALRVTPDGHFVFGFGRDATGRAVLTLRRGGRSERHEYELAHRDWRIQRVDGVPQRTVAPPGPELLKRIHREVKMVRDARATDSDRTAFLEHFRWPLTGPITGVYGSQRVYNGKPGRPHYGVDIARPRGTIVRAPADGVVTLVDADMFYSGGTLIVDHGYGVSSTFIHLSRILVKKGQRVAQGQPIARVGSSGRATGAHLDWRVNWYQTRLDPQTLVPAMATVRASSP